MFKVVSDFCILRHMIGFDSNYFAALLNLNFPCARKAFPNNPAMCDENTDQAGTCCLNLRLIMFLALMRCRNLNSFSFEWFSGF